MHLEIEGPTQLKGTVPISGAKNAALPCMFATLLSDETSVLTNIPDVADIATASGVLDALGNSVTRDGSRAEVDPRGDAMESSVPGALARSMRASILSLGPLLAKRGQASVPLPGGCDFGERPIDIHLSGLEQMGAKVNMADGVLNASCDGLVGTEIRLKFPTFTGTENLLMAATLAKGTTTIFNAAREPEVVDLAMMLNAMGASVSGAGTSKIVVEGVDSLFGTIHRVMPDRIEMGTYLAATAAAGGHVTLTGTGEIGNEPALLLLRESGARVEADCDMVSISMEARPEAMSFATEPYPGFPTDLQAQFMAVNCVASGEATIVENVWEKRFRTAEELRKLGSEIQVEGNVAKVTGVERLHGGHVVASDLRASAALVIAGICAHGTTMIDGVGHLQRGYEDLPGKLGRLGATVRLLGEDGQSAKIDVGQQG